MKRGHVLAGVACLVTVLALSPVAGQGASIVRVVGQGDAGVNAALQSTSAALTYLDADGDQVPDTANPDETYYVDRDASKTVSHGDIRLTPYLSYDAGTAVNYTNRDTGKLLAGVQGWFGHDQGAWYLDVDDNGRVSTGDLRLTGPGTLTKVRAGGEDVGTSLTKVHQQVTQALRMGWRDTDGIAGETWGDPLYVDVNVDGQVSTGDLEFRASALGIDDGPTGRQFRAAVDNLEEADQADQEAIEDLEEELQRLRQRVTTLEAQLGATSGEDGDATDEPTDAAGPTQLEQSLRTWDRWLLVLAIVNLGAVGLVGYWVHVSRNQTGR